jgi:enoyl-CoA hydratase/carnithine racemase
MAAPPTVQGRIHLSTESSDNSQVTAERRGRVAVLSFANPPEGFIALKGALQLLEQMRTLLADDAVRAVVLTGGQPGVFIRHADVGQIGRAAEALARGEIEPSSFLGGPFFELGQLIQGAEKPVIAAIDGVCMGGGFEIALACCARIASRSSTAIGLPEIRIGIFPSAGGTQRLPRLIGRNRARLFILAGAVVDAAAALEIGIIDEVAPCALDRALELAESFARRPAGAVAAILRLTRDPPDRAFEEEQIAFAELLRDDPQVRARLRQFVEDGERIDQAD